MMLTGSPPSVTSPGCDPLDSSSETGVADARQYRTHDAHHKSADEHSPHRWHTEDEGEDDECCRDDGESSAQLVGRIGSGPPRQPDRSWTDPGPVGATAIEQRHGERRDDAGFKGSSQHVLAGVRVAVR